MRYRARRLALLLICKSTVTCGNILEKDRFGRLHLMRTTSQEKTAQNVGLAASEQLGFVFWIRSVKRVKIYSQNKGSKPCAVKL